MPIVWRDFVDLVNRHQRFVLTSHMRPDCDALGSELGLAAVLKTLGKQVRIVNGDEIPRHLAFIDPANRVEVLGRDVTPDELVETEVLIVLDTSAWGQLGPMADLLRASQAVKVGIDHHVSDEDLGVIPFKNIQAEATGRLIVEAADALGVKLTAEMAVPLFAAIATDTGWFRFSAVTGETYRTVGRLIDAGVQPEVIFRELYEQDTLARVRLRGRILGRAETELEGRLIYSTVTRADFDELGAVPSDTEDVINQLLRVVGTEVAILFMEQAAESIKTSFRSRCHMVDVRTLAEQFGGGGHLAASGATQQGPLEQVRQNILDATRRAMR